MNKKYSLSRINRLEAIEEGKKTYTSCTQWKKIAERGENESSNFV
jgi:hypothetical protein